MAANDQDEIRYTQNYKIDYAHIDVAQLMEQVQAKAASRPAAEAAEEAEPCPAGGPGWQPPGEPLTMKKKIKNKLLRFFKPFFPAMRLLALPVHEELQQTNLKLSEASDRIDRLYRTRAYIQLLHVLCHNLVQELTKLKVEHDTLKSRVQVLEKDFEFLGKREKTLEKQLVR